MKTYILKSLTLSLLLVVSIIGFSQDKIKLKNQSSITCTVTKLGQDFISYTQEDTKELVFQIEVENVAKIVFESGKELSFATNEVDFTLTEDRIYRKNQEVITCTIVELGEEYIKYTQEDTKELVFSIDAVRIEKVVFASGKEFTFMDRMVDEELYSDHSKNAFKIGILSPVAGALSFGYERSIKPGASIDVSLGLIGVGFEEVNQSNVGGAYFDVGYKFMSKPNIHTSGSSYRHLLSGFYFKPKVALAMYGQDFDFYYPYPSTSARHNVIAGALLLDLGWQWIIGDAFLLNMYGGFGYGFDNMKAIYNSHSGGNQYYEYGEPTYHYGFTVGGNVPIALTAGLKIGFTK